MEMKDEENPGEQQAPGPRSADYLATTEDVEEVLIRLIGDFKSLVKYLNKGSAVPDFVYYSLLLSQCPFCGSGGEDGMGWSAKLGKLVCLTCGEMV